MCDQVTSSGKRKGLERDFRCRDGFVMLHSAGTSTPSLREIISCSTQCCPIAGVLQFTGGSCCGHISGLNATDKKIKQGGKVALMAQLHWNLRSGFERKIKNVRYLLQGFATPAFGQPEAIAFHVRKRIQLLSLNPLCARDFQLHYLLEEENQLKTTYRSLQLLINFIPNNCP
jgi:hypothetical protein